MKVEKLNREELFNLLCKLDFKPLLTNPETFIGRNNEFSVKISGNNVEYVSSNGHIWGEMKFSRRLLSAAIPL